MRARVKQDYRWKEVMAFGGHEYTKDEYRPVPPECEEEAGRHPFMEIEAEKAEKIGVEEKLIEFVEPVEFVAPVKSPAKPIAVKRGGKVKHE